MRSIVVWYITRICAVLLITSAGSILCRALFIWYHFTLFLSLRSLSWSSFRIFFSFFRIYSPLHCWVIPSSSFYLTETIALFHKVWFWTFLFCLWSQLNFLSALRSIKIAGHEVRLSFNLISHLIGFKWLSVHQMQRKRNSWWCLYSCLWKY